LLNIYGAYDQLVNHAPVATDDLTSTPEDTAVTINALANDSDIDVGATLSIASVQSPTTNGGTVVINPDNTLTYTPALNWNSVGRGRDTFTYTITDGLLTSAPATVSVRVDQVNDRPVAVADTFNVDTHNVLSVAAPGVLSNDFDIEGSPLTATIQSQTGTRQGTVVLAPDGSFTFTHSVDFFGTAIFTYYVNDGRFNGGSVRVNLYKEIKVPLAVFRNRPGVPQAWIVRGASTVPGSQINVYLGPTVGGTLIGTAVVGADQRWELFQLNPTVIPAPGDVISVQSTTGQRLQNVPVTINN